MNSLSSSISGSSGGNGNVRRSNRWSNRWSNIFPEACSCYVGQASRAHELSVWLHRPSYYIPFIYLPSILSFQHGGGSSQTDGRKARGLRTNQCRPVHIKLHEWCMVVPYTSSVRVAREELASIILLYSTACILDPIMDMYTQQSMPTDLSHDIAQQSGRTARLALSHQTPPAPTPPPPYSAWSSWDTPQRDEPHCIQVIWTTHHRLQGQYEIQWPALHITFMMRPLGILLVLIMWILLCQLYPIYSARMSLEITHKLMGFYTEVSILGVILLWWGHWAFY